MFEQDGALLLPDRRPVSLREIVGSRGIVVVGVGRGAERGFQMVHRFHDVGEQLAAAGIHLAFIYPRESTRHVLDSVSVASARFRRHPYLLLDPEDRSCARVVPARLLAAVYLSSEMARVAGIDIDLRNARWESEFRAFLSNHQIDALR